MQKCDTRPTLCFQCAQADLRRVCSWLVLINDGSNQQNVIEITAQQPVER
jgi:hypothetical protein